MFTASQCTAVPPCAVSVVPSLELRGNVLNLSDLVKATTCPGLLQAAREVHLGAIPLPGSIRVFEQTDIAARLRDLAKAGDRALVLDVPERVTIRQAGLLRSCRKIAEHFSSAIVYDDSCGAAGRISESVPLEIARKRWDPLAKNWDLIARCQRSIDCVPFLIRLPQVPGSSSSPADRDRTFQPASRFGYERQAEGDRNGAALVHRGEQVMLVWDQDGIRLLVPALSLEEGRRRDRVRVRTLRGGRVFRAVVESKGTLRVE
jgi:hypothetical protein